MNKLSNLTFISIILLPVLVIFFQNCSELVGKDSQISPLTSSKTLLPPLMLTSSTDLGFTTRDECPDESGVFYNPTTHLCYEITDQCEAEFLLEKGYSVDEDDVCAQGIEINQFDSQLLTFKSAEELGYKSSSDLVCTQQYKIMVNIRIGLCTNASDGCKISYLESLDFSEDTLNLCQNQ